MKNMAFLRPLGLTDSDIDLFLAYIKKYRGVDLSFYRKTFLSRRLQGRFEAVGAANILEYVKILKVHREEWERFIDKLSINVSEFFRDWEVFKFFRDRCIADMVEAKLRRGSHYIRCWSCGCSCGEEPYSLAILFREALRQNDAKFFIKIHATDVDEDALSQAREGEYERKALINCARMGDDLLGKYFTFVSGGRYRVKDEIKSMVSFERHNLLTDKPLEHIDVVFFRNVQIYFSRTSVDDIVLKINNGLNKYGYLVLGKVETIGARVRSYMDLVSPNNKIFKKI